MTRRICPFSGLEVAVVDFEFFYDQEYSLSAMPTAQFMHDSRFELMISGVELEIGQPQHYVGDVAGAKAWLSQFDLESKLVVAHSAFVEGSILEWLCGITPKRYWCTLAGSRPFFVPWTNSASLESLALHLGLQAKGEAIRKRMKGKHLADLTAAEQLEYVTYNLGDVSITGKLWDAEAAKFKEWNPSGDEAELIDLTIKKFTRPQLRLDRSMIAATHTTLVAHKQDLLTKAGVDKQTLMSDTLLASYLEDMNIPVPMKWSAKQQKQVPAFARTDRKFIELLRYQHAAPVVNARLAWKSTIEESRLARFHAIAKATDDVMPAPLLYYGALTGRWSGVDKLNLQNLGRGSQLRATLVAPPGYVIVTGDLSQIEARITACLAGQKDLLEDFRCGRDPYARFATRIYGRPIEPNVKSIERLVGKVGILSLGYVTGKDTLHFTLTNKHGMQISLDAADNIVRTYRSTYSAIPRLWSRLDQIIELMASDLAAQIKLGPITFGYQHMLLPNGMPIFYRELQKDRSGRQFVYYTGKVPHKLFSGTVLENMASAMARIILTTAELKVWRVAGYRAALSVHDELVYVVKERVAAAFKQLLTRALSAPVRWMPELPVACEVKHGKSYLDAK